MYMSGVGSDSKNGYQKDMCKKKGWIICSNYDNHCRLNIQQN